jgi:hypothetical protein
VRSSVYWKTSATEFAASRLSLMNSTSLDMSPCAWAVQFDCGVDNRKTQEYKIIKKNISM